MRKARWLWFAAAFAILAWALVRPGGSDPDDDGPLFVAMLALGFPASLAALIVAAWALVFIIDGFELSAMGGRASLVGWWVVAATAGYVQWFVVVPWLRRAFTRRPPPPEA